MLRSLSSILALEVRADVTGIQIKDTSHVKKFPTFKKNKEKNIQGDNESTPTQNATNRERMITNLYVLFTFHTNVVYRSNKTGNDYFHTFAHHLQEEFMEKPVDKILSIIDQVMEVSYT